MVGIQVGNEQEERKGEEKKMIRENFGTSSSRAMRETTSAVATWTTTSDMWLQLGGERERDAMRDLTPSFHQF